MTKMRCGGAGIQCIPTSGEADLPLTCLKIVTDRYQCTSCRAGQQPALLQSFVKSVTAEICVQGGHETWLGDLQEPWSPNTV